jgi:hypothetical protein
VLWSNLPGIDLTPRARSTRDAALRAGLRAGSLAFNRTLEARLAEFRREFPRVRFVLMDAFDLFDAVARDPGGKGFTDAENPGVGASTSPDAHVFWDDLHVSAHMHRLIAETALAALRASSPAPSSAASPVTGHPVQHYGPWNAAHVDLRPGHLAFAAESQFFTTSAFGTLWIDLSGADNQMGNLFATGLRSDRVRAPWSFPAPNLR